MEPLTVREEEVLFLLGEMLTIDEIAREMFLSRNTIKVHLRHVYEKLDVPNQRKAVRRGRELGLVARQTWAS